LFLKRQFNHLFIFEIFFLKKFLKSSYSFAKRIPAASNSRIFYVFRVKKLPAAGFGAALNKSLFFKDY
jgi:hypothetical protein